MEFLNYEESNIKCFECDKNLINIKIKCNCSSIYLCDECLQELNRKIVDYLADKNI